MSVTVVSCVYNGWGRYQPAWAASVAALERQPEDTIIRGDDIFGIGDGDCPWKHPQAYYLDQAVRAAETDWVWILDIDDTALPDALNGIDAVTADVWMMGFERSDGEIYIPPALTAAEVIDSPRNLIPAGSAIRTAAFRDCGGYLDVALQDWALWRRLAENGATFETSGRAHYRYNRHPATRGETELTVDRRPEHMAEMLAAEEGRYVGSY